MKKRISAFLLLLSLLFSLAACGERIPAENPSGGTTTTTPSGSGTGDRPGEAAPDAFTVTVMLDGAPYTLPAVSDPAEALSVRWADGKSTHTRQLGADGKASIEGLDGDYTVTLINVPEGYTYNPNIYRTSNENNEITVELLKLTKTFGKGVELYDSIRISKSGVYRATVNSEKSVVYYEFNPTRSGIYHIESIMDVSADMYNPVVTPYIGSAFKNPLAEIRGGGVSGTYTKNFKCIIDVSEEELGGYAYTIAIRVEGKDPVFPAYVDFSVSYKGASESVPQDPSTLMLPTFNFEDTERFPQGYKAYLEENKAFFGDVWKDAADSAGGTRVFNEELFRLNPDDGFYHVYDEVVYAATEGWGPILYADISIPHIFSIDGLGLNLIEYEGNKALTVSEGTENYKLFIEGFAGVTDLAAGHNFFCDANCPCRQNDQNGGGCLESANCPNCLSTCRPVPDRAYGMKGYADYAVDGRAPVTEELKIFLQKFSENQRYFSDGNGWVEGFGYTAFEESQWLFPCGYYTN